MGSIKTKIDLRGVDKRISPQAFQRGRVAMVSQIAMDTNRFVPLKSEHLRNSEVIDPRGEYLEWNAKYAHYQYTAPGGWHYSTPGTGPAWYEKAKSLYLSRWVDVFKKGSGN